MKQCSMLIIPRLVGAVSTNSNSCQSIEFHGLHHPTEITQVPTSSVNQKHVGSLTVSTLNFINSSTYD